LGAREDEAEAEATQEKVPSTRDVELARLLLSGGGPEAGRRAGGGTPPQAGGPSSSLSPAAEPFVVPGSATPPAAPSGPDAAPAMTSDAEEPVGQTAAPQALFMGLNLDTVPRDQRPADVSAPRGEQQ
jgi:hypothetical protein